MIKLGDIKGRTALSQLSDYNGKNPYITKLKLDSKNKSGFKLTDTQSKYVIDNLKKDPIQINKLLGITEYIGIELKKQYELDFIPQKIMVSHILAETDKTFHVYAKFTTKGTSKMFFIPKTQLLDDPYFDTIEIDVDFEKYTKIDKFKLSDGTIGRIPYEHQKRGVKFLLSRDCGILAAEPGLGKTWMSIVAALESKAKKILIVCPASLKINWKREIECFGEKCNIVNSKYWETSKFTIINYDILKNFHAIKNEKNKEKFEFYSNIVNAKFDLVIIDEAHFLSDSKSIRGEIMSEVCVKYGVDKVWLLTGTPITNRPINYYNLLKLVKSPIADNWDFYTKRYCDAKTVFRTQKGGAKRKIRLTTGASNIDELSIKTRNILLRQKKSEAGDMPDKTVNLINYDLSENQQLNYDKLWDDYLVQRKKDGKRGNIERELVELILLRKFIAMETIPNTVELANNIIEQDEKVVIFTNFTEELEQLKSIFGKKCVVHNGPMSDEAKQESVDRFQNDDEIMVFIGNIRSAGVGITLTKASNVIFNSFSWVPGENNQSEDRCHRLNQKFNVSIYYQLFNNSISTMMWGILENKKEIINKIIGEIDNNDSEKYIYGILDDFIINTLEHD